MINAILVDDEIHARNSIKAIVSSQLNEINFVAEAGNVAEAVKQIKALNPHLLFLDINLPDGNGFDILMQVEAHKYKIIFITAYQEFAIQAIKFSAFDYILKPINPVELIASVQKCIHEELTADYDKKIESVIANMQQSSTEKKVVLKTSDKIRVVNVGNIVRCQADNVYTNVFLSNGEHVMVSKNLKSYEEMLHNFGFMRTHQSHLINVDYIEYYQKQDGGYLVMTDASNVPVSNANKPILLEYLESL